MKIKTQRSYAILKAMGIMLLSLMLFTSCFLFQEVPFAGTIAAFMGLITLLYGNYIYIKTCLVEYEILHDGIITRNFFFCRKIYTIGTQPDKKVAQTFWMKWINVYDLEFIGDGKSIKLLGLSSEDCRIISFL